MDHQTDGPVDAPSEDVRDGMRVLDDQKARLDQLRRAVLSGELGVSPENFDLEAFLAGQQTKPAESG